MDHDRAVLYKGITSDTSLANIYLAKPIDFVRVSTTSKINGKAHDFLLNNLSSWQDLPKRSHSIITTTNLSVAEKFAKPTQAKRFGKMYVVMALGDPVHIVISPNSDIFYSFGPALRPLGLVGSNTLVRFNRAIREILLTAGFDETSIIDWNDYLEALRKVLNQKRTKNVTFDAELLFDRLSANVDVLEEYLDNLFSPKNNGFTLSKLAETMPSDLSNNEIWTNSDCILFEYKLYCRLRNANCMKVLNE